MSAGEPIPLQSLPLLVPLPGAVYHTGGALLHRAGELLSRWHIQRMAVAGIHQVCLVENAEAARRLTRAASVRDLSVVDCTPGQRLAVDVYDDAGLLILVAGTPLTESAISQFLRRGIARVAVESTDEERELEQVKTYRRALSFERGPGTLSEEEFDLPRDVIVDDPVRMLNEDFINRRIECGNVVVAPGGEPLRDRIRPAASPSSSGAAPAADKQAYVEMRSYCIDTARDLFSHCNNGGASGKVVRDTSTRVVNALVHNRELLLSLIHLTDEKHYLPFQAVNTTIIAINLATALGYSARQVHELAYGAFLHDVGMLRVPPELLFSRHRLREDARQTVERHTTYGIELLQKVSGIPISCPIVAYQHHERLDGSGYPRQRRDALIHSFSRVVMIADIFSAMIGPRPFRTAHLPFVAMNTVLRLAKDRRLDVKAAHAFLQWMGLFPVGSWVVLQDGRLAKIVAVPAERPDRPTLRVLFDTSFRPVAQPETIESATLPQSPILSACDPPISGSPVELALAGM